MAEKISISIKPRTTTNLPLIDGLRGAIDGAEKVNATINGTVLTVTDRNGESKSVDTKGEPGEVSKAYLESELNKLKPLIYAGL